jgi:uncharacterized Zn-binding protein involved in type VI secretion
MPSQGRLGDKSQTPADGHGCPGCPHPAIGPAITGSPTVFVNSLPALRVDDMGIHAACCGPNMWKAVEGSATVFINGKAAHRMGDKDKHCGGDGKLVQGSANVFVGDSGGGAAKCNCDQAQLMKDASKSGTPFFEAPMTAAEKAKQAAMAKAKQAAQEMAQKSLQTAGGAAEQISGIAGKGGTQSAGVSSPKPLKDAVQTSGGATDQAASKDDGFKLKELGLSDESKEGYTDPDAQTKIKIGVEFEKKIYDDQLLYYGDENANIKIGHAKADKSFGYGYDPEKGEHEFTLGKLSGKASVIDAEVNFTSEKGLVDTSLKAEALSVSGEFTLPSITVSKEKLEVATKVGVEANLVKGELEGKINITPKTIYDNTVGSVVGWFSPESKYTSAPKWMDHGIVIGAKGEAGIGAAASAEAKVGATKEMIYAEAELKAGFGPMAGVKLLFGVK